MSFLKNIGKSLTDFGQDVANQSKNINENAKLKAAIQTEEKKIDDLYKILGKTYVDRALAAEAMPDSPIAKKTMAELSAMDQGAIVQIRTSLERIKALNAALAADKDPDTN